MPRVAPCSVGLGAVAGVDPGLGDAGVGGGDGGEQVDAAGVVGDARRGDPRGEQETDGVDADVAFASHDLLARVDALTCGGNVGGGFDALRVRDARARLL